SCAGWGPGGRGQGGSSRHAGHDWLTLLPLQVSLSAMTGLLGYVDVTDSSFAAAALCIAFNPLFWNLVARWEHRTRSLTRLFGSPYTACYCLGAAVVLLNFLRSHCFTEAMKSQPKLESLDCLSGYYAGLAILGIGVLFVVSSFFALGFVGTFLGDYFGILMEAKVMSFPFNVLDNPMYWGSTHGTVLDTAQIKTYTVAMAPVAKRNATRVEFNYMNVCR
uniref:Phosphatidylethanolamine N-methyltransferase n=1 Tax=Sphenodon punctatus TaxID=8508 RepID=A0A8D0G9N8_SPHPU